jgi:hypothetical protein
VNIKHVAWEPSKFKNFWWHPYDEALGQAMKASAKLLYGQRKQRLEALRTGAGPLAKLAQRLR